MTNRALVIPLAIVVLVGAVGAGARYLLRDSNAVTTSSQEALRCYEDGMVHYRLFRHPEALDCFQRAVKADSSFAMAHLEMASVFYHFNENEKARAQIQKAYDLRDRVSELEALEIERRYALQVQRDFAAGDSLYTVMTERYPDDPITLRLTAAIVQRDQDYERAIEIYEQLLEEDPESVDAHNQLGYLFLRSGRYQESVQSLKRYAYYAPDQANPHDSLGEAYYFTGRYEEAISEYLQALEIEPTFLWSAAHLVDVLRMTGQFSRARELLDRMQPVFAERNREDWLKQKYWEIDYSAEKWDALLAGTEEFLDLKVAEDRSNLDLFLSVHFIRARCHLEKGDYESAEYHAVRALKTLESFYDEVPESARNKESLRLTSSLMKAMFYRKQGKPQVGIEKLREAIAVSQLSPHMLVEYVRELAECYYEKGQYGEAASAADAILEVIPTYPALNLVAAKARSEMGQAARAQEHLKRYMEVMQFADDGHPREAEMKRLYKKLVAAS